MTKRKKLRVELARVGQYTKAPPSNRIYALDEEDALNIIAKRRYAESLARAEEREAKQKAAARAKITLPKLKCLEGEP